MVEQTYGLESAEADTLARDILRRLESADPLSHVLPAARRLARLLHRPIESQWLEWEISGLGAETPSAVQQAAYATWERLHLVEDPIKGAAAMMATETVDLPNFPRAAPTLLMAAPISVLEAGEKPAELAPGLRASEYEMRLVGLLNAHQRAVLLVRVRGAVHAFVADALQDLMGQRARAAVLGPDAVTVFAAGGALLERLGAAVNDLGRPGREASACIEARSALEQIGLQLCTRDDPYVSPVDGKPYDPRRSETHRLHAVLDDLWTRSEGDRRDALAAAHALVKHVRDLGARAKTQPIPHSDALEVVVASYRVAHAICFAGGFPPQQSAPL